MGPLATGAAVLARHGIRLLRATVRFRLENARALERAHRLAPRGNHIYALWHRDIPSAALLVGDEPHACLISLSKDGDFLIKCATPGVHVFLRGSPSRDGARGLIAMVQAMNARGVSGIFAVDGSRGPAGVPKPGVLAVARRTGVPVVPLLVVPDRFWEAGSWDRMRLPKPFSTVTVRYGEPIGVPRDAGREEFPGLLERLARELGGEAGPGPGR